MRRLTVFLAVLAAVAAIGVVVSRAGSHESGETTTATVDQREPRSASAQPADDLEAARDAAVAAVALTDDVARAGFISRRELIESFTTPSYGPTLANETSEAVTAMLLDLGERDVDPADLHVVEQPISARAEASADGVRVSVWSVLIVAVPGTGPGRQVWRTVTLDMVKVGGRWLVDHWSSEPGPTPSPAAEAAFDDAKAFVEPLGWPPATPSVVR
ncbi:MAG: hypothetical protein B7C54_11780 [Acidimicrobiales bacterium mtb01]|nr:MAG: hypothetical protein B7C54_11780 [Acidimicrobiales bacterium mtb01]